MSTNPPRPPDDVPDGHLPPEDRPPHDAEDNPAGSPPDDDLFDESIFDDAPFDESAFADNDLDGGGDTLARNRSGAHGVAPRNAPPQSIEPQNTEPRNNVGTTSLVCGISSLVLSMIPILNLVTWPLGAIAVVFGAIGWNLANRGEATNKSFAVYGLGTGLASFFIMCGMYTGSNPTSTPGAFGL